MKKIVFCCLPMKAAEDIAVAHYSVPGNSTIEYKGEVRFPVNGVLARTLKQGDDVKVVLLGKDSIAGTREANVQVFKDELDGINQSIHANIEYKVIATPFDELDEVQDKLYRYMAAELEPEAEITCDITYGPKTMPIVLMGVLRFADKFFNADIANLIYGKADFIDGKPCNFVIYDVTALYYLNCVTEKMTAKTPEEALEMLDLLVNI